MNSFTCVIVEDEPLAQERLADYISKLPTLKLLASFDNALEAMSFLKTNSVDVLFLDIQMDELSGIQLLENTSLSCQVIITTAYQEYALKGYELRVKDYLLKPFTFERFVRAVHALQDSKANHTIITIPEFIFVKTENRLEKIVVSEILYVEGMRDYLRIHTATKKIMTLQSFLEFEQLLPSSVLCRVHKSYMVAIKHIDSVERSRIKIGEVLIPVSDSYRDYFFSLLHR
ncbi:MAG: LytTR family DNA-binding domain-containing protein [Cytophagaceae bacterium]|jgi:DNA-binding LytR/AlgR family response regulator|nr:LytTR family DNA-binding domain-containing protein [Cytophagaceae bacterium]